MLTIFCCLCIKILFYLIFKNFPIQIIINYNRIRKILCENEYCIIYLKMFIKFIFMITKFLRILQNLENLQI